MPTCVVPTCKNWPGSKNKIDGITYHRFPTDILRREQWTKLVQKTRLEYWIPTDKSIICSAHFEEKFFYFTKLSLRRLTNEAFPSKNMIIPAEDLDACMETSRPQTSKEVTLPQSPVQSDPLIGDVNVSDLESVFDSPRNVKLKSQLLRKENLCQKHVRKISALTRKCKRLMKQNKSLKSILRHLKKNNRYVNEDVHNLLSTDII